MAIVTNVKSWSFSGCMLGRYHRRLVHTITTICKYLFISSGISFALL